MKKIAVIGTGIMGSGIALNYLKNGYQVVVWNRSKDKLQPLIEQGAITATTPKEAAEKSDIVFEVSANDESSRLLWLGKDGILAGVRKDSVLISSGTFSTQWVDALAKICAERGLSYFDMTLTGGRIGAETGKLTLLVGGDEKKLEEVKPDLQAISEKVLHFGKAGSGTRYKLLLNMLQAIHIVGLGEVLKIAEKTGMDVKKVGDALAERPGGTTTILTWRDYQKTPDPINFSIQWIAKDLEYARQFADSLNMPLLDEVIKKYSEAVEKGLGQSDWTAVTKI